ncbi:MAG: 4Fe-4S binding protein [Candidatus Bathyarchaeota archaeon]|nr:4Fe-4S binding protein [Candidatus Bathyarchaeota archaeon]
MVNWAADKTKRVSTLRFITQCIFLLIIFYVAIIGIWKGLLLLLIFGATFLLGRLFCGWMCPFGLYMDTVTLLRRALKVPHWSLPNRLNLALHKSRYITAACIFALAIPIFLLSTGSSFEFSNFLWMRPPFSVYAFLLEPLQTPVLPWNPPFGALFEINGRYWTFPYVGEILLYLRDTGIALPLSYVFVGAVLAASFKVRRFWCRFCPTGISFGALNRFRALRWLPLLRLSKNGEKCTKCGICQRVCPLQVTEVYEKKDGPIQTTMCTVCLRCVEMCPEQECLSVCFSSRRIWSSRNWLDQSNR